MAAQWAAILLVMSLELILNQWLNKSTSGSSDQAFKKS